MMKGGDSVPKALRAWFVIHFAADILFAVPLFLFPRRVLSLLGWFAPDPIATRLVAAALFGIGIQSLLGRNEARPTFVAMLNLKIIWSGTAALGLAISLRHGGPVFAWLILGIFAGFCMLWTYWRRQLAHRPPLSPSGELP
jgi:hypothetical protein